jgi:outer membrane receptor protein involved in Fe transport
MFHAENHDDILFVTSERTGFGYFRNFGQTRRQGFELGARAQKGRVVLGTEYTFLLATFRSEETLNGESNSANDAAEAGLPGLEGSIEVEPGDQIPLIPRHLLKVFADLQVSHRLSLNVDLVGSGSSYARGNENNLHEPGEPYYVGEGAVDGYAVVNLGARYGLTSRLDLIAQLNNLFDRQYATAAQLGPAGFTVTGRFLARPLPAVGGQFPLVRSTFLAPGAPLRAWFGVRARF